MSSESTTASTAAVAQTDLAELDLGFDLPPSLLTSRRGPVAVLTLAREHKRNALDDRTILGIEQFLQHLPHDIRAVVISPRGDNFSAGLDLSEMDSRDTLAGVHHSRVWHRVFDQLERGTVPVVSVLKGAVIGGGLELAAATHVRVAEESAYFALPEGQRGLFVGGGASVRVSRLIGVSRMSDMMLTGRRYTAAQGENIGLNQYVVPSGQGLPRALELADAISTNAPQTNFAILQALPRINDLGHDDGLFVESLMAAIAQGTDDAKNRMNDFLGGRAGKVTDD